MEREEVFKARKHLEQYGIDLLDISDIDKIHISRALKIAEDKNPLSNRYTEGICEDGAAILKDGVPMKITEILEMLNNIKI